VYPLLLQLVGKNKALIMASDSGDFRFEASSIWRHSLLPTSLQNFALTVRMPQVQLVFDFTDNNACTAQTGSRAFAAYIQWFRALQMLTEQTNHASIDRISTTEAPIPSDGGTHSSALLWACCHPTADCEIMRISTHELRNRAHIKARGAASCLLAQRLFVPEESHTRIKSQDACCSSVHGARCRQSSEQGRELDLSLQLICSEEAHENIDRKEVHVLGDDLCCI